jgi:acetyl-CoA C-acetyltransferase
MSGSPTPVFIVSAARTPIGAYLGGLSSLSAPTLGATAIGAALERSRLTADRIEEVFFGNVLSAGLGQAPARQAALKAKLPNTVPCTTVNKVCGSGLEAVVLGARAIATGDAELIVAGGMESMSNVPYYLTKARSGYRIGNGQLVDGMIFDGLWDPYNDFHMGNAGELCAEKYGLTRELQDAFAGESYKRARAAQAKRAFDEEIVAVQIDGKGTSTTLATDEEPSRGDPEKFSKLKPAFTPNGTITAANASSLSDGAAALVLASETAVKAHGLTPLARIVAHTASAQAPEWFTTAPATAIDTLMAKAKIPKDSVDLWEINEAFSCVTMACTQLAGIDPSKVNVRGGAVALGHPIGATGARILTTLLFAMKAQGAKRGVASLCIGGGEALAVLVDR